MKPVEFPIPESLAKELGNLKPGSNMEMMVNFHVKDGGKMCIAAVEGVPFPGFSASGEPEEGSKEEYMEPKSEFVDRYQAAMAGGEAEQPEELPA